MPGLTPEFGLVFSQAATVCLDQQGHTPGVRFVTDGQFPCEFHLKWLAPNDQMRRTHNDFQDATEFGACWLAIFRVRDRTGLVVVERSRKGTGFDFWLGDEDDTVFQHKARLEVSGILQGTEQDIAARVTRKLRQIARSDGLLPGYVAVVDFCNPRARERDGWAATDICP
jgi:hypothetical protein